MRPKRASENFVTFLKLFLVVIFSITFTFYVDGTNIIQEHAVLDYWNPKYLEDVRVFTSRSKRNSPYRTNVTATTFHTWGNNVTFRAIYYLESGNPVELTNRVCEAVDKPWMVAFIMRFSNLTVCPVPPGRYRYYNMEIPPKNFPFPIPKLRKGNKGNVKISFHMTATKELLLEFSGVIRA